MITDIIGISGTRDHYINGRLVPGYPSIYVKRYINSLPLRSVMVVTGGAIGVDLTAERCARDRGMAVGTIPYFRELGKRGGYERNTVLVDFCTQLACFWDLESQGTYDTIKKAKKVGKLKCVYGPNGLEIEV